MQARVKAIRTKYLKILPIVLILSITIYILRNPLKKVSFLIIGASILAFLAEPVSKLYEKKLNRPLAAFAGLATIGVAVALFLWFFLPIVIREIIQLAQALPGSIEKFSEIINRLNRWIEGHLSGLSLPNMDFSSVGNTFAEIASGTIAFAGNVADIAARFSLMVVLSYFLLRDRQEILLRLELMIPQSIRPLAVRMGNAVSRELRLYLRGQSLIALVVAAIASVGLMIIGIRSAVILGPIVGIMNMIPYFGPFIGGVPAVLVALGDSWQKAALTVIILMGIQQLDNTFISPRIIGNITGLSPGVVLVSVFAGAQIAGIAGMLFSLPVIMTIRTIFRIFVQKYENI